ncbi:hypothetical protein GYMLUDRAFT_59614 [Collybiopsis luxurians FD-317 M1]|uniref:Uncharacterized protein n=1 Tax=Collybiopsis luxurians FD-317 M1 TaxID=944289 RepID=A0A0D0CWP0_9AGAR|nr:hypothetical protein GYMLUDRAFT_59614 [Collybiopsis luxurians FD-317 M1]
MKHQTKLDGLGLTGNALVVQGFKGSTSSAAAPTVHIRIEFEEPELHFNDLSKSSLSGYVVNSSCTTSPPDVDMPLPAKSEAPSGPDLSHLQTKEISDDHHLKGWEDKLNNTAAAPTEVCGWAELQK